MSLKALFITLILLGFAMVLTSALSRKPNSVEDSRQHKDHAHDLIITTITPSPDFDVSPITPSPTLSSSSNSDDDQQQSSSDSVIFPAIPFASQEARMKTFLQVQQQQSSPSIQKIIDDHNNKYCGNKYSQAEYESRFKKRLHDAAQKMQTSPFLFKVMNFPNDEQQGDNNSVKNTIAGHQRVFIVIVWNDDQSNNNNKEEERVCVGGAAIEGSLSSSRDLIDIDFFIDVSASGNSGLYEIQPFFRRVPDAASGSSYKLCLSLNALNPDYKWKFNLESTSTSASSTASSGYWDLAPIHRGNDGKPREFYLKKDQFGSPDYCVRQSWSNRQCFTLRNDALNSKLIGNIGRKLSQQRIAGGVCRPSSTDSYLRASGSWMKIKSCTTSSKSTTSSSVIKYCVGNPKNAYRDRNPLNISNANGDNFDNKEYFWVFVSDACLLRIYSRAEAWRVVDRHWFLFWGDSTLKQPVANMIEYTLGTPVFGRVFMEHLESIKVSKKNAHKRPGFFTYRQYDVTVKSIAAAATDQSSSSSSSSSSSDEAGKYQARVTNCWGGCPNIMAPPNCGEQTGMKSNDDDRDRISCVTKALGISSSSNSEQQQQQYPTVIVLNHFVWRFPMHNMTRFFEQVEGTLNWLDKVVAKNKNNNNPAPILIWIGGVRPIYEDVESAMCAAEDARLYWRTNMWRLDEYFAKKIAAWNKKKPSSPFRSVHYIARHDLTSPLHYSGSVFGHFGVHYGATTGMCLTGVGRSDKYGLNNCWRNAAADWMLIQMWLSILDNSNSNDQK